MDHFTKKIQRTAHEGGPDPLDNMRTDGLAQFVVMTLVVAVVMLVHNNSENGQLHLTARRHSLPDGAFDLHASSYAGCTAPTSSPTIAGSLSQGTRLGPLFLARGVGIVVAFGLTLVCIPPAGATSADSALRRGILRGAAAARLGPRAANALDPEASAAAATGCGPIALGARPAARLAVPRLQHVARLSVLRYSESVIKI